MKNSTMDLLYINPNNNLRKEIENLGAKIEDASDYIHEHRVSIHLPKENLEKYFSILKRFNVSGSSLNYLTKPKTKKR